MKMHKVERKVFEGSTAVASEPEGHQPSVHLSDIPLPDADVGDKIFIKIQGKVVGKSEQENYSSLEVEMDKIGFEDDANEFTALSRDDD